MIGPASAKIERPDVRVTAGIAVHRSTCTVGRRIGEARVQIIDAAQRPFAKDLLHPSVAAMEENRLPQGE